MATMPSQKELNTLFLYDPVTGIVTRKITQERVGTKGDIVGYIRSDRYREITIKGVKFLAHRVIWTMTHDAEPEFIDHVNGSRDDNRLINLRNVDRTTNNKNKKLRSSNKVGVAGVYWVGKLNKWTVRIGFEGKNLYLGCFLNVSDAIRVRRLAEIKYGFHKNHGRVM